MKKFLPALLLVLALLIPALAQKTQQQLTNEVNSNWPDNTTQLITPAILRSTVIDIINSYISINSGGQSFPFANYVTAFQAPPFSPVQMDCGNGLLQYVQSPPFGFLIAAPVTDSECRLNVIFASGTVVASTGGSAFPIGFTNDWAHNGAENTFGPAATVAASSVTFSVATPTVVTWSNIFSVVGPNSPVFFTSANTMPTSIVSAQLYYVSGQPSTNAINLSTTPGGAKIAVNVTGGSNVFGVVPSVWQLHAITVHGASFMDLKQVQ